MAPAVGRLALAGGRAVIPGAGATGGVGVPIEPDGALPAGPEITLTVPPCNPAGADAPTSGTVEVGGAATTGSEAGTAGSTTAVGVAVVVVSSLRLQPAAIAKTDAAATSAAGAQRVLEGRFMAVRDDAPRHQRGKRYARAARRLPQRGMATRTAGRRASPATTHAAIGGAAVPRLPHERDESSDSVESAPRDVIRQAHDDLESGKVDTDRGPPSDAAYRRQKAPAGAPPRTRKPGAGKPR